MSIRQHDFTIERRFRQTPAQAFRAFADPELKQRWFGVPGGWTDANWELDFRVGGSEVSVGRDPRGALHEFRSRYHDIVDGERIVFAYDLLLDGRLISVSLTTVEVRPDGDGTRLVFTEHGAFFDDLEDPAEREHGTGLLLDGLAAFLDAAYAQARETAGDDGVDIAGGASTVRQALVAGVVDELTLDIAPVLLGSGERIFDGVGSFGFEPVEVLHSRLATHIRYRRAS